MYKIKLILIQLLFMFILSMSAYADNATYRIVGGQEAEKNKWPWMIVQIPQDSVSSNDAQTCGGSLIHKDWILTAAHCFISDETGEVDTSIKPDIVIGRHDLSTEEGQRISISEIIVHPSYNPLIDNNNDVALLKLSSSVSDVTPIMLPGQTFNASQFSNVTATAIGWGNMAEQSFDNVGDSLFPTKLQQLSNIPVVSNEACKALMGSSITDQMLCAGFVEGGKDTCQGDSGGPLFVSSNLGSGSLQIGVSSWGFGCAQPESYGVYARVGQFSSWISEKICSSSEIPQTPILNLGVNGQNVTVSYNSASTATHYRLYYAPAQTLSPINYIEMESTTSATFSLPVGSNYKVAVIANNNNCISGFSTIEEFSIQ